MDEHRIAKIVEQVVAKLNTAPRSAPAVVSSLGGFVGGRGVHPTVDAAVTAAGRAFKALSEISLKERKRYIDALRSVSLGALETMAQMAVDETGLGRVSDKIEKNRLVAEKTPGIEALQPTTDGR